MIIALYAKSVQHNHENDFRNLFGYLGRVEAKLLVHNNLKKFVEESKLVQNLEFTYFDSYDDLSNEVDFLLSIGGDGTFLDTITLVRELDIPILGINMGRLGFLSNTATSEMKYAVESLLSGDYTIEKRSLLSLTSETSLFGLDNYALNEISIMKRDSSSMITIHTELDGMHLNSYWTDGLIISTATGSTAYSLSCGGPILMPGSGNFVITPIAPHNLNVRPIVIGDESVLKISVESRVEKSLVALDSRSKELKNQQELIIQKASHKISLNFLHNRQLLTTKKE